MDPTHSWRIPGPGVHAQLTACGLRWRDLKVLVKNDHIRISEVYKNATVYTKHAPLVIVLREGIIVSVNQQTLPYKSALAVTL